MLNDLITETSTKTPVGAKTTVQKLRDKHKVIVIDVFPVSAAILDSKSNTQSTRTLYPAVPCYLESDISDATTDSTSGLDDTMPGPPTRNTGADAPNANVPPGVNPADSAIHTG